MAPTLFAIAEILSKSRHDELRAVFLCQALHFIVVDKAVFVHSVGHEIVIFAGEVHGASVGEVSAVGEVHAHYGIAVFKKREVDRRVRLRAGMGLDVGMIRAEKLAGTVYGDLLDHVDALASAVVSRAGISLGILIGKRSTHGHHDSLGHHVLAGDKLETSFFALILRFDCLSHLGVDTFQKFDYRINHYSISVSNIIHSYYTLFSP